MIKAKLMIVYKGAMTYTDLEKMPIDHILHFGDLASKISEEEKRD